MKVSVCIPTFNRPEYLKQAIDSCLGQTMLPYEIIIGDDSKDDKTKEMINSLDLPLDIKISYNHHKPSLKQAENTNFLFRNAQGEKLLLLHDDDLLLPEAIETMVEIFKKDPEVQIIFGKQYLMSENGEIDYRNSEYLNDFYFRTKKYEGSKLSPVEAGIIQQFPNDGFMINKSVAIEIPWRTTSSVGLLGNGNEMDWSIRVGLSKPKMFFVNKFLVLYRITAVSNSSNTDSAYISYLLLENLKLENKYQDKKELALKRKSHLAVRQALKLGKNKAASRIFLSKHNFSNILTLGYYKSLALICISNIKGVFR